MSAVLTPCHEYFIHGDHDQSLASPTEVNPRWHHSDEVVDICIQQMKKLRLGHPQCHAITKQRGFYVLWWKTSSKIKQLLPLNAETETKRVP